MDKYIFKSGYDIIGYDILFAGKKPVGELLMICHDNKGTAFNTLGFIKKVPNSVVPIKHPHFKMDEGIYILDISSVQNQKTKIRVMPMCNWCGSSDLIDELQLCSDKDDIILVDNHEIADYFIIINFPHSSNNYKPNKTIVFQMEPKRLGKEGNFGTKSWGIWENPDESMFLNVRTHKRYLNNAEWHIKKTYHELLDNSESINKTKNLSIALSSKQLDEGHFLRINFVYYLEKESNFIDIYGRCKDLGYDNYKGELPPKDKTGALYPYKYSIAIENNKEHNYVTEKFFDCIMAECLCFYWGCPNLDEYFPNAFIRLELKNFKDDFNLIKTTIENNEWERRIGFIRNAKKKILTQYQIFPTIRNVIIDDIHNSFVEIEGRLCVSLLRRNDRRIHMNELLTKHKINGVSIFDAIDGTQLEMNDELKKIFDGNDFRWRRGVIGCAMSHYTIWKQLLNEPNKTHYLIFEDDIRIVDGVDFNDSYKKIVYEMKLNNCEWDIVMIGYTIFNKNKDEAIKNGLRDMNKNIEIHELNKNMYIGGTFCYMLSKNGAKKLLDYVEKNGIKHGIDYMMIKKIDGMNNYEVRPQIIMSEWVDEKNSVVDSDIQKDMNPIKNL